MSFKQYQPLRVFSDWKIEINCFFEVDPSEETMSFFAENLLYAVSEHRKRAIELQWQPEDNPKGNYVLKVINLEEEYNAKTNSFSLSGDWANPYLVFTSKKRLEIVDQLEELMFSLTSFKDERILISRGIIDRELETLRIAFLRNKTSKENQLKILGSKNAILQNLLLDNLQNVTKEIVLYLSEKGATKGIKNKAKQFLNHKKFN